ncbi:MAG: hypothetical protein Q9160_000780 [Pyrenula sp. 1 TL-2023]
MLGTILTQAAETTRGMTICRDDKEETSEKMSYYELLGSSRSRASKIRQLPNAHSGKIVLLHFATFRENVEWFWAVIMAGMVPSISTPLPVLLEQRQVHLKHIARLLRPLVLTSEDMAQDFSSISNIDLQKVDDIDRLKTSEACEFPHTERAPADTAVLMLTSGSSGSAKAVMLRHEQTLASVQGKSRYFGTTSDDTFLNWIGFDHVASLVETHLHAMYLGANFVHLNAATALEDPTTFLKLIHRHRVAYTFAPQFFLFKLRQCLEDDNQAYEALDLSCLRCLISGGESNLVDTASAITKHLRQYGLSDEVIKPGFGMTETCAGCIYNKSCPSYDQAQGYDFASLGTPIPGLEMRVADRHGKPVKHGEIGDLQITGKQVFQGYYNDEERTKDSFTEDGWFVTSDRAFIDFQGCLNLVGREKETINVNGLKYSPQEIENALENASIDGLTPSWTVVFSYRQTSLLAEDLCVVYLPTFNLADTAKRVETARNIVRVVGSLTFTRPKHIVPLPARLLHKSSLGKLPRAKIRASLENGDYAPYDDSRDDVVRAYRKEHRENPATALQLAILNVLEEITETCEEIGVSDSIFDFGITSLDLFLLKKRLETKIGCPKSIPLGILLMEPTVKGIATQLERLGEAQNFEVEYDPVVILQSSPTSNKTPLWLIHPGSGDVLVFVALAKYFPDRTVYGLRTKGLNTGLEDTDYFISIDEIADCYNSNIRKHQPMGPYALAGYSLGSSVAFEVAKRLEASNQEVACLGLLDSPPHMRALIEKLDWVDVLLNVAYFLELVSEERSSIIGSQLSRRRREPDQALDFVLAHAPPDRLEALAIDKTRLRKMTDVTHAFGMAGKKYDPDGRVQVADVFWVTPLTSVASGRKEWMDRHLVRWKDFVVESPRFHECEGVHSKMLNAEYVNSFQKVMKKAMAARGI